ncbi:MAG: 4-hydroxy-tetrahydrodipicolinate reductase [Bacteroidales bacterium]|nr:4-hydroxy-tetrahydrodipicolinate reductase [Bacteroidales bacterium]
MKIALIGYGKMGHAIEDLAVGKGHKILCTVDNAAELNDKEALIAASDVAIEFSTPNTATANIEHCLRQHVPVVCGTTGWYDNYDEVIALCRQNDGTIFTATNFSIGMNIMFAINERLAELMHGRDDYRVSITETHHIHKLDAPSGTAISLRQQIAPRLGVSESTIDIESIREGEVPGTHVVRYDSDIDTITISHEAHSRKGLAAGALMAAEFVCGKKGIFTMKDLLGI